MTENRNIVAMLENLYLLRKLFCRRVSERSPLHFAQISIMKTIEDNENCTQATIAEQLGVTPASVAISTLSKVKTQILASLPSGAAVQFTPSGSSVRTQNATPAARSFSVGV